MEWESKFLWSSLLYFFLLCVLLYFSLDWLNLFLLPVQYRHRPLFCTQFCLMLWLLSSSNCTWSLPSTFLFSYLISIYSWVALILCGLAMFTVVPTIRMNEWNYVDFNCVRKPTESRHSLNSPCRKVQPLSRIKKH